MEEKGIVEEKKNNKLLWCFVTALIVTILAVAGILFVLNNKKEDKKVEKARLEDDYYESINYGNSNYSFNNARSTVATNLAQMISTVETDANYTDENYFNYIELYDDSEGREERGLKDLQPYFDAIDSATTIDEFSDIMLKINYDFGVVSLLNWELSPNIYDTSQTLISFEPIVLENLDLFAFAQGVPSGLEFFSNEDYAAYKNAFEKARIGFLKLYGYDEEKATKVSNDITEFAKVIQEKSLPLNEYSSNVSNYFKLYSKAEVDEFFNNLPIDKLLEVYGISDNDNFALLDEGHLKALDEYYTEEHLPVLKEVLKVILLEDVAALNTTSEFVKVFTECYRDLSGQPVNVAQIVNHYEQNVLKPKLMGSYLNYKYDEKYFTELEKLEITELIQKVIEKYKDVINNSEWMSDETKAEALNKLENITINVGYVQKEDKSVNVKLIKKDDGGTLIGNIILLRQEESSKVATKINEKLNIEVDQFIVNAYYNFLDNSINFPSAFREIYRGITDKYETYGFVGTIIAHEISHAFDKTGSLYDENGNLRNWWTDEDRAKFDSQKQAIIDYYSKYSVLDVQVDGENTVSENIADLGAVKTILTIMESENATKEDYIKFFESYAKLWNTKVTKAELERNKLSDSHSPNKVRTNAVLSSMDKFYEVYDIKETDGMYIAKDKRVSLW